MEKRGFVFCEFWGKFQGAELLSPMEAEFLIFLRSLSYFPERSKPEGIPTNNEWRSSPQPPVIQY